MTTIYHTVEKRLKIGESVVLATVIETRGSTPRKAGAKMAIFADGTNTGTIGGGSAEASVVKLAGEMLPHGVAVLTHCNLDDQEAADLGMICGGEQRVLLVVVPGNEENHQLFQALAGIDGTGKKMHLVTMLRGAGADFSHVYLRLFDKDWTAVGLEAKPVTTTVLQRLTAAPQPCALETIEDCTYLVETFDSQCTMYIFGAGHVARPTVAIATIVGFQAVVLDDRSEFANSLSFPQAKQIFTLPGFDDPFSGLTIDENSYIVIVTRGHTHDQSVLAEALKTSAAYIGMIGSLRKIRSCFESLKGQGVDEKDLARVHAPIGLNIGSETPEEIGCSIVAELIQVRAQLRKRGKK
ncbi:XdhC family aldehyde oxidoreductase maturation factor [Desulforhopalus sp. IMCC35007]|uniref:XdhC family aldehyde oxidoreductase maturation factor n=1 Tax=Desulforhopalus sp. IMCC35007 TaxID=2569543 RepID=UPI0010AE565B|nr:XdhC/CoxI family protein [Desulforhopalus sp. IMCC35007]TKB06790.1 XdhC family protein [Desulforhopalus sp. IMCC35007]